MATTAEINIQRLKQALSSASAREYADYIELLICGMENGHPVGINAWTEKALGKKSEADLMKAVAAMEKRGLVKAMDKFIQIVDYPEIVKRTR